MPLAAGQAPPASPPASPPVSTPAARVPRLLQGLTVAEGAGLAALVAYDGSPLWRVIRVLTVVAVTAAACLAYPRLDVGARGGPALFLGTVCAAAGGGIGLRYLSKAGWRQESVVDTVPRDPSPGTGSGSGRLRSL